MSLTQHIRNLWKQPKKSLGETWRNRLVQMRREPSTIRLERPTRLDRARSLGYKAKQGIFVVRQRVLRGGHIRQRAGGRKGRRMGITRILHKSYQEICEERAADSYSNCEVLNSYWVAQDGKYYWYEVILVDRSSPSATSGNLAWMKNARGRVYRGLTSAAKKTRGLRHKGKGAERVRPSRRAHNRTK